MLLRSLLAVVVLSGCAAHAVEQAPPRDERVVLAVAEPPPPEPAKPEGARPRLSQTVTLGQTDYAPPPVQAVPGQAPAQPGVVVNNNVTVVQQPPVFYGGWGYGGYGYGGVVRDGGYGRSSQSRGTAGWSNESWGGAQRTAAPGRTPGVGGNWAPAPSHGPRQMK
jgi:hypothetical protein